jgi:hypothetical protein
MICGLAANRHKPAAEEFAGEIPGAHVIREDHVCMLTPQAGNIACLAVPKLIIATASLA